ncbi:MAG: hypothetical protein V1820_06140 [archaeon]
MRRAQATLEFLVILAVSAAYLSAAIALTGAGFAGVERAALAKNRAEVSDFLDFSGRISGKTRSSLSENFTIFPTGWLDVFSDGKVVGISTCGKFSGIESAEISLPSKAFGLRKESCDDFGLSGKFGVSVRKSSGGVAEIEISDFD